MRKQFLILCSLLLTYAIHAEEQVIRLTPTDDVYTYKNGDIRGMEDLLKTYHSTAGSQYRRITYLKFDISKVPTVVDSVKLRLYTNGWQSDEKASHQFDVYPVALNNWAEDDLTYANYKTKAGADQTTLLSSTAFPQGFTQPAGWIEWTGNALTQYIQDSASAAKDRISFRIREKYVVKSASDEAVVVDFHSKEHSSGFAPELIIYSPEGAMPAEREEVEVVHDSAESRLSMIYINGEKLEFFDKDRLDYTILLPYTSVGEPVLSAVALDTIASYSIHGNTIICTSADQNHSTSYTASFEKLPQLDIVLAIGQSNMAGRAPYSDATEPMENIYLLTPAGYMEVSSNPMNKYSNIRKDLSVQGMGPHYTCALTLRDSLQQPIAFVVNAQGGSSINAWYTSGKTNYDATIQRARQAQRYGNIRAIIWHQGSADNSAGLSDNFADYKTKLATMVQNMRSDLGLENVWFIAGELSEREVFDEFNTQVIQTIGSYIPLSDYVETDGTTLMSDNTHFDEASVRLLGERYAAKILEHVYPSSSTDFSFSLENNATYRVYNMQGQYVGNHIRTLPAGCYIMNREKIVITY